MTTKTTDLWLSRDPDGEMWLHLEEPVRETGVSDGWWFNTSSGHSETWPAFIAPPTLRKGTKRPIRVTVEVLR